MNVQVRYYTKTGHTKKLAEAIAKNVGAQAKPIANGATEEADVLFLGASIYAANLNSEVRHYIEALDPAKVKEVVVFSTSALIERAYPEMKKRLEARGIKVRPENYYCRGQFSALHRGRPNAEDVKAVEVFASDMMKKLG